MHLPNSNFFVITSFVMALLYLIILVLFVYWLHTRFRYLLEQLRYVIGSYLFVLSVVFVVTFTIVLVGKNMNTRYFNDISFRILLSQCEFSFDQCHHFILWKTSPLQNQPQFGLSHSQYLTYSWCILIF